MVAVGTKVSTEIITGSAARLSLPAPSVAMLAGILMVMSFAELRGGITSNE